MGSGSDKHQPGLGNEGGEVGHCTYSEENQRRVPAFDDSLVEYVEHRTFFIYAYVHSRRQGNVAYDYSETYGDKQQWLPFFDYSEGYEQGTDCQHKDMLPGAVVEARKAPELLKAVDYLLHCVVVIVGS